MSRSKTFISAVLALLLPALALAQQTTPSEDAALEAYRRGDFSQAVQLYTRALSETPEPSHRARLHVNIAWTLFALGRESEVATHLRAALLEDPSVPVEPDYYTQEFMELYEAARRTGTTPGEPGGTLPPPPDLEATLTLVDQRIADQVELEAALADLDRLIESYPDDGRLVPLKVQILGLLGRSAEAEELLRRYGSGVSGVPMTLSVPELILRANQLLNQGDVTTSLELLREAVARQPSNVAGLEMMAEAAQRGGQWQEAEFALKSALGLQPDNINLKLRLGEVYLAQGQPSAARDIFRELTERFPQSDRAWASLGLLDARLGNRDRAIVEIEKSLNENPLQPEVQLAYGELLMARGQHEVALQSFRSAASLLQDDIQLAARTGQALLALGRDAEALPLLRRAVDGGFSKPDVERALALAMVLGGLASEGERLLSRVAPDDRGDSDLIRARLLLDRGRPDEAERVLRPIAERRAGEPLVLNLLAASIYDQGRFSEAQSLLERAAELASDSEVIATNLGHARAATVAVELAASAQPVP